MSTKKLAALVFLLISLVTANYFLNNPLRLKSQADSNQTPTSVAIHPGQILTTIGATTPLSALAYDQNHQPIGDNIFYDWGTSTTGIGNLYPAHNLATFRADTIGNGDIWTIASNPNGQARGSIKVYVVEPQTDTFTGTGLLDLEHWGYSSTVGSLASRLFDQLYFKLPQSTTLSTTDLTAFPRQNSLPQILDGQFEASVDLVRMTTSSNTPYTVWQELKFGTYVASIRKVRINTGSSISDKLEMWIRVDPVSPRYDNLVASVTLPPNPGTTTVKLARVGSQISTYYNTGSGFQLLGNITYAAEAASPGIVHLVASNENPANTSLEAYFDNFSLIYAPTFPTPYPTTIISTLYPTYVPYPTPYPTTIISTPYPTAVPTIPVRTPTPAPTSIPIPTPTPITQTTTIDIYAAGSPSLAIYPVMELRLNGTRIARWTNVRGNPSNRTFLRFTYRHPSPILPTDTLRVAFTNNFKLAWFGDRNLRVDRIVINGATYQSESPTTYGTGARNPQNGCGSGYFQTEWLYCNGYFQYSL
ncbi:MAG: carbohydrate-binding domain-containing protein [Patescibacteria group bacterium]